MLALVLVLPQIELPEFSPQSGSASPLVKLKLPSPPGLALVIIRMRSRLPRYIREAENRHANSALHSVPYSLLSVFCTLRC
jgi:hypothetical protein